MNNKNQLIKTDTNQKINNDVILLVEKKIDFFKDVIQKTIIHVQKNKFLDILGISDVSICIERLSELGKKIKELNESIGINQEGLINGLQFINNEMSSLFKNYGTENLDDLISICFGNNNKIITEEFETEKFELLKKYFHPTSYKVINKKEEKTKKGEDVYDDSIPNLTCNDVFSIYKQFHMKVYGMKIYIYSTILKKSLIIFGIVDDIIVEFLNNKYIMRKCKDIRDNLPQDNEFQNYQE